MSLLKQGFSQGITQGQKQIPKHLLIQFARLMHANNLELSVQIKNILNQNVFVEDVKSDIEHLDIDELRKSELQNEGDIYTKADEALGYKMEGDGNVSNDIPDDRKAQFATRNSIVEQLKENSSSLPFDDRQIEIAEILLNSVDEKGFISDKDQVYDFITAYTDFTPREINEVHSLIKNHLQPLGIGSMHSQEALYIQINHEPDSIQKLTSLKVITECYDMFINKDIQGLARTLNLANSIDIDEMYSYMSKFKPIPLDEYQAVNSSKFNKMTREPDLIVKMVKGPAYLSYLRGRNGLSINELAEKTGIDAGRLTQFEKGTEFPLEDDLAKLSPVLRTDLLEFKDDLSRVSKREFFAAEVNKKSMPKIIVDRESVSLYKDINQGQGTSAKNKDAVEFYKSEALKVKEVNEMISRRNMSIEGSVSYILNLQEKFVMSQDDDTRRALLMKDVAVKFGLSTSMVSNIANDKLIQTEAGKVMSAREFFERGVSNNNGSAISNGELKEKIKTIISTENILTPITDNDIQAKLKSSGLDISYPKVKRVREDMKIPSVKERYASYKQQDRSQLLGLWGINGASKVDNQVQHSLS